MSTNSGASKTASLNAGVTHLTIDTKGIKDKPAEKPREARTKVDPDIAFRVKFQKISSNIQKAARNLDDVLAKVKDDIAELFDSERVTIYGIDGVERQLVSRVMVGNDISEIRVPVNTESIVGFAASKQKIITLVNAYDRKELAAISPELTFDRRWDEESGFKTQQVLVCPVFFHRYLMGAIQFINRKSGTPYSRDDEKYAKDLSKTLGVAMYTHKKAAKQSNNKYTYLLQKHIITPRDLKIAMEQALKQKMSLEKYLITEHEPKLEKEEVVKSLSQYYETPYVLFDMDTPIPTHLMQDLRVKFLKTSYWVPLRSEGNKVIVALDDPQNLQKIDGIKRLFPKNPLEFHVALKEDIVDFIDLFTGKKKDESLLAELNFDEGDLELAPPEGDSAADELELVSEESSDVVKLVNKIIIDSYKQGVSDIHIEPQAGKADLVVRIRIDGSCQKYPMRIPYTYRAAIASRIKIMANLDIAERRLPQDGKIQFKKYSGLDIELRVATIPTQGGVEDIVMRILAAGEPIPLENMGFAERNFREFVNIIQQPYGIIFVCGPTGSGKTTTLHSALKYINKVETKIWTAEDPVEITQKGLRQVQMHPKIGLTFASAMRAFLRADPDVIMVGEMRDKETTSIGIEASLTGHLVFSTLHTNSAAESVVRLLDMGMDPFNFADAVLGILAQRLLRTLCKHCKEEYHPSRKEYDELVRDYRKEYFEKDLAEQFAYNDDFTLYKASANGCDKCNKGYAGRMGMHELMIATDDQKRLIQTEARVEEMRQQAMKDGMRTLKMDGVAKVFKGFSDIMQVRKVCIN